MAVEALEMCWEEELEANNEVKKTKSAQGRS